MITDSCIAWLVLGASFGALAGSWNNPGLGMALGADAGVAIALIWHVLTQTGEQRRQLAVAL